MIRIDEETGAIEHTHVQGAASCLACHQGIYPGAAAEALGAAESLTRRLGRTLTMADTAALARLLRETADSHHMWEAEHNTITGGEAHPDHDGAHEWPRWYAESIIRRVGGEV